MGRKTSDEGWVKKSERERAQRRQESTCVPCDYLKDGETWRERRRGGEESANRRRARSEPPVFGSRQNNTRQKPQHAQRRVNSSSSLASQAPPALPEYTRVSVASAVLVAPHLPLPGDVSPQPAKFRHHGFRTFETPLSRLDRVLESPASPPRGVSLTQHHSEP